MELGLNLSNGDLWRRDHVNDRDATVRVYSTGDYEDEFAYRSRRQIPPGFRLVDSLPARDRVRVEPYECQRQILHFRPVGSGMGGHPTLSPCCSTEWRFDETLFGAGRLPEEDEYIAPSRDPGGAEAKITALWELRSWFGPRGSPPRPFEELPPKRRPNYL